MTGMVLVPWHVVAILVFAPTLMALVQLGLSRNREYDVHRLANLTPHWSAPPGGGQIGLKN